MATSEDGGRSWHAAKKSLLPNPNAKMNMIRLSTGALAAAYNGHGSEQVKRRSFLTVSISQDDGLTWKVSGAVSIVLGECRPIWPCKFCLPCNPDGINLPQVWCALVVRLGVLRVGVELLRSSGGVMCRRLCANICVYFQMPPIVALCEMQELAVLESRLEQELRFHYPALRQLKCSLLVTYSVMTAPKSSERGGIRLVSLPLCFGSNHLECPC